MDLQAAATAAAAEETIRSEDIVLDESADMSGIEFDGVRT